MRYHIFHIEPDPFNFHDWDVPEDFVMQIVRGFLKGMKEVKINGVPHRIGMNLLIYEFLPGQTVGGILVDSMIKHEATKAGFSRVFFERKFKNVTDRFIRGRLWGELKEEFYNIFINDEKNKRVILVVSEHEVRDFLAKWAGGESPIWVSGRRIDLNNPKSIKIFDIGFEWLSKNRGDIKADIKKHVNFVHRGVYRIAALEHFGKEVTEEWNVKPYGKIGSRSSSFDWGIIHAEIYRVASPRFNSGHFADAVEAAFKELNDLIKKAFIKLQAQEDDGVSLMRQAFKPSNPVFKLNDLKSDTDRSIQDGYMQIFAGAMAAIRNPKAHANLEIDQLESWEKIILASHLMKIWDKRKANGEII